MPDCQHFQAMSHFMPSIRSLLRRSAIHARAPLRSSPKAYLCSSSAASSGSNGGDDIKARVMKAALANVGECGWTHDAIVRAVKDTTSLSSLSHTIVERGPVELVEMFLLQKMAHVRLAMAAKAEATGEGSSASTSEVGSSSDAFDPVYEAIGLHLDYIQPHLQHWPAAMALLVEPQQVARSSSLLYDTVDDLCRFEGVKTSRMDWYVERAALLALYSSAELFMLTDSSQGLRETKAFLRQGVAAYRAAKGANLSGIVGSFFRVSKL